MDMKSLNSFIQSLKGTGSRIEKENILRTATEDQKKVLEFLFNPYKPTGIGRKKLNATPPVKTGSAVGLLCLLKHLEKHNTGSQIDVDYVAEVAGESGYPDLVYSIVAKDLVIGVNATTLNKVFGKGFIPTFGVQLAERYDFDKGLKEGEYFILTEKLDGVRCVLMFDNSGNPHFYARSGRKIIGLVELAKEARQLNSAFVYDGELLAEGKAKSNNLYRETMSIVGSDGAKVGVVFNVFDMMTKAEYEEGVCSVPASTRKKQIERELEGLNKIRAVPVLYQGKDQDKIMEWLDWAHKNGKEGVMINIADAPYITDRNGGLLKVKTFKETEAVVRSIETGTGKNSGRLGAIIVDIKDKVGNLHSVRVGSGFKDKDRDFYFTNQDRLLGKVVEIGYFEVTKNKANDSLSLRFPTWLDRVREDKAEEDMSPVL